MNVERPAPGIEVHHSQCPDTERALPFAVCYSSHPGCWYVQRRAVSLASARMVLGHLRKSYGGTRPRSNFRIWDTAGPWPNS